MPPNSPDTRVDRAHPTQVSSPGAAPDNDRRHWPLADLAVLFVLVFAPAMAQASFLSGAALDKMADILAIVVLCIVPLGVIILFWMVHVLPEKIAERRHHPQQTAIKTLCLLSLVFGGMLWPFAWLWAYTKPVVYKMAYGTDKHEDYFREAVEQASRAKLTPAEREALEQELEMLAARDQLTPELRAVRERLAALRTHKSAQDSGPDTERTDLPGGPP